MRLLLVNPTSNEVEVKDGVRVIKKPFAIPFAYRDITDKEAEELDFDNKKFLTIIKGQLIGIIKNKTKVFTKVNGIETVIPGIILKTNIFVSKSSNEVLCKKMEKDKWKFYS